MEHTDQPTRRRASSTTTVPLGRYSTESACSDYATDPPVIVDLNGKYYGRLTLNSYHAQIGIGVQLMGWLAAVCHD
jgi:hypothetical protein